MSGAATPDPTPAGGTGPPPVRRRVALWAAAGAVVVVALAAGALTAGRGGEGGRAGTGSKPAPAVELPRLDAPGTVSLAALRGRPVVVNFFASWCGPCRRELPAFQAVADRLDGRVAFLGVDHQDNREAGLAMLADTGVRFPSGYDPEGSAARAFGLFGMPTTVFVSAEGNVLETHTGEMSRARLEERVSRLFGV